MGKTKIALILGIVCFLLTIAICIQIKTMDDAENEVGRTSANNRGLRDEILTIRDRYNEVYRELESAESELEQVRAQAASNNTEDAKKEEITSNYETNTTQYIKTLKLLPENNN